LTARKIFILAFLLFPLAAALAQSGDNTARFNRGLNLYGDGFWGEAIVEFRRYQQEALNATSRAEAQFWIAMAEMSAGEYNGAIHDFDEIARIDPLSIRRFEVPYQKARSYFYLGRYNEAIGLFTRYADSIRIDGRYDNGVRTDNWFAPNADSDDEYQKKASAIYWIGECLYNLDEYDKAAEMYDTIITQYQRSRKYEPSTGRIALIKQKKIEDQLLRIVRNAALKQDEATATSSLTAPIAPAPVAPVAPAQNTPPPSGAAAGGEQFGSAYNDAMLAYKNSIAPFLLNDAPKDSYTPAPQQDAMQPARPSQQQYQGNAAAQYQGNTPQAQNEAPRTTRAPGSDTTMRLLAIKTQALEMMERLTTTLSAFETINQESW
jgi:tetratricopeptide (TPR) repeat protein